MRIAIVTIIAVMAVGAGVVTGEDDGMEEIFPSPEESKKEAKTAEDHYREAQKNYDQALEILEQDTSADESNLKFNLEKKVEVSEKLSKLKNREAKIDQRIAKTWNQIKDEYPGTKNKKVREEKAEELMATHKKVKQETRRDIKRLEEDLEDLNERIEELKQEIHYKEKVEELDGPTIPDSDTEDGESDEQTDGERAVIEADDLSETVRRRRTRRLREELGFEVTSESVDDSVDAWVSSVSQSDK